MVLSKYSLEAPKSMKERSPSGYRTEGRQPRKTTSLASPAGFLRIAGLASFTCASLSYYHCGSKSSKREQERLDNRPASWRTHVGLVCEDIFVYTRETADVAKNSLVRSQSALRVPVCLNELSVCQEHEKRKQPGPRGSFSSLQHRPTEINSECLCLAACLPIT